MLEKLPEVFTDAELVKAAKAAKVDPGEVLAEAVGAGAIHHLGNTPEGVYRFLKLPPKPEPGLVLVRATGGPVEVAGLRADARGVVLDATAEQREALEGRHVPVTCELFEPPAGKAGQTLRERLRRGPVPVADLEPAPVAAATDPLGERLAELAKEK